MNRLPARSLREASRELRPEELYNELRLHRCFPGGERLFLLVEGQDDRRFWSFRLRGRWVVRPAGGKPAVLKLMERLLEEAPSQPVAALVDADFDRLRGLEPPPRVGWTDAHDLESTLLLLTDHLDRLLHKHQVEEAGSALPALLERALPLGQLRWLNDREGWGLEPGGLRLDQCFDHRGGELKLREDELRRQLLASRSSPSEQQLVQGLEGLGGLEVPQLVQGHDLLRLVGLGLSRGLWGSRPEREVEEGRLRSDLYALVQQRDLEGTAMWAWLDRRYSSISEMPSSA